MTWQCILFEGAMAHVVHDLLAANLVADMAVRGCRIDMSRPENPKATEEWAFDIGGFWVQGEPEETIHIDGLTIDIPCCQFDAILPTVEKSKERTFANGDRYHKLKFWIHATVLTPTQHALLLCEMYRILPVARERGAAFDAAFKHAMATVGVS